MAENSEIKISGHQLPFCPWECFWNKVKNSDVFILFTALQFSSSSYEHRVNWPDNNKLFTVPVKNKQGSLKEILISDHKAIKHAAIRLKNWSKRKEVIYRSRLDGIIRLLENYRASFLIDLNLAIFMEIFKILKLNTIIDIESRSNWENGPAEMINEMIERHNATIYLAGSGTTRYMNRQSLNIEKVLLQEVTPPYNSIFHVIGICDDPVKIIADDSASWIEWK